jgi:Dna[CI] antecedent, DciA
VSAFEASARPRPKPKRKNHGRAQRASELAWREVLATVPRDRIELARLQNAWPGIVPRHLQAVAWPAWLSDGRLLVHVGDNQWLHELTYLRHDLLAKLRRACPSAELRALRLRVGEVELVPAPEPVPDPRIPGLPREPERATIEAMEAIEDATLRDAVAAARLALGSR